MARKHSRILHDLTDELRFFSELGAEFIPSPEPKEEGKQAVLLDLEARIRSCELCPLARTRKTAVPGEGNYGARLMFIGEAPGADEDAQGRPFVGRAGQLLTRIIEAMGLTRKEVYITNVVKCRPPDNRTPLRSEIESCRHYLLTQIETIAPRVIVTLGKVATDVFHPSAEGMSQLRGTFRRFGQIFIMPTFHPAYILRNEGDKKIKRMVWEDMQKVMAALGKT